MKNVLYKIILSVALVFTSNNIYSQSMENDLKVEYKVVESNEIKDYFFKDNSNVKLSDELYVVGYISQALPFKYDIYCKLYFFQS